MLKESDMEKWRVVKDYDGYFASTLGRIKTPSGKIHSNLQIVKSKYFALQFRSGNVFKTEQVHRVIAKAFIPNVDDKPIVNHKNGDTVDNRVENLEWVTYSENAIHYHKELKGKMSSINIGTNKYKDGELVRQSNFAKLVNQSSVTIHYLIAIKKLKPIIVGKTKFIENNEENRNIAKRKTNDKK